MLSFLRTLPLRHSVIFCTEQWIRQISKCTDLIKNLISGLIHLAATWFNPSHLKHLMITSLHKFRQLTQAIFKQPLASKASASTVIKFTEAIFYTFELPLEITTFNFPYVVFSRLTWNVLATSSMVVRFSWAYNATVAIAYPLLTVVLLGSFFRHIIYLYVKHFYKTGKYIYPTIHWDCFIFW